MTRLGLRLAALILLSTLAGHAHAGEGIKSASPPDFTGKTDGQDVNDSHTARGGKRTQPMDGNGHDCSASTPCPVGDANNAAFISAVPLTVGAPSAAPGRSIAFLVASDCNISLQLASGMAFVISVAGSPYTQTLPFSVTGINASGTTCSGATYTNLN